MSLEDYVAQIRRNPFGISLSDVSKVKLSKSLIEDINHALASDNINNIQMALFFLEGLLPNLEYDEHRLKDCAKKVVPQLIKSDVPKLRLAAYKVLIILGTSYPSFKEKMFAALSDSNPLIRQIALSTFNVFADKADLKILLPFAHDMYISEVAMGSHLVYLLRNDALKLIESLVDKKFIGKELFEISSNGKTVYWWDWEPFYIWYKKKASVK